MSSLSGLDPCGSEGDDPERKKSSQNPDLQQSEQQELTMEDSKERSTKPELEKSEILAKAQQYTATLQEISARAKLNKMKRAEANKNLPQETVNTAVSSTTPYVSRSTEKLKYLRQKVEENK